MENKGEYPTKSEIIYLLGLGALIAGSVVLPGLGIVAKSIYRYKNKSDWDKQQKE